ncbi:MAG: fibronectin type III domain-containing protein, partial [Actinobacteria bacterium]|nr:fibronectin type III domain-containing protein [Actinomycetota bacterium]
MNRTAALPRALARRLRSLDKPTRMGLAVVLAVSAGAVGTLTLASSASAAVPAFPNNIVVFPDRDFVSVEGYEEDAGKTMTVTVTRNNEVIGKGEGEIAPGGVAIEVNHPGGVCWGTGTDAPNVTPDIKAGDVVSIAIDGEAVADTRTGSGTAATSASAPGDLFSGPAVQVVGSTLYVRGTVGADIVLAQGEQRIINPDMVDTAIQRRDVRAVPGPLTPAPRGGYSSMLEFDAAGPNGPARFLATYQFDTPQLAALAAAGGTRYMSWELEDLDANRQGLTIAEFGELGGPGFGGCPAGPQQAGPPAPGNVKAIRTGNSGQVDVSWTPAAAVPGTPAITGYRVSAVSTTSTVGTPTTVTEQEVRGAVVTGQAGTGTTLTDLDSGQNYTVNVRSINALGLETLPGVTVSTEAPDIIAPTLTLTPDGGTFNEPTQFTLDADEGEIYYMLTDIGDPEPAISLPGGTVDPLATLYTAPFTLSQTKRISAVAVDEADNATVIHRIATFDTVAAPTIAPTLVDATGGASSIGVTWAAVTTTPPAPAITGYRITYTGTTVGAVSGSVEVPATPLSKTVTGVAPGTYSVTVAARNLGGYGPESAVDTAVVNELLSVNAGADGTISRAGAAVPLNASTPNADVTYLWERVTSDSVTAPVATGPSCLSASA